jgi:hypothetical protein
VNLTRCGQHLVDGFGGCSSLQLSILERVTASPGSDLVTRFLRR